MGEEIDIPTFVNHCVIILCATCAFLNLLVIPSQFHSLRARERIRQLLLPPFSSDLQFPPLFWNLPDHFMFWNFLSSLLPFIISFICLSVFDYELYSS